ncbi:DUF4365 domain-containing protein [Pseudomonas sp. D2002]|uniref:DUF4365 domain-containing protein n=1 Tax=Pseudomonas sp. D2002 TaxID=2726980 RepID=UPI00159FC5DA|nr:DUF4365 domain-containing protein [Pseudomonas sp. D2002]NWA86062.1 DUF4365 domain-containing protein [Pseudomonas sp. D2002]
MSVEGPLPQTGDQHDINADADSCLRARRPQHWRIQSLEGTDDYGFDYQVQTTPNQQVRDVFRIQLKGTRSPSISADGEFISVALKASTVRYYNRVVEPILLVICDLSVNEDPVDCPLHYVWIHEELSRINVLDLPAEQKSVTLKAPRKNLINRKTDLSLDIDQQNDYSRVGHLLGGHTEQTHPDMPSEERLLLVQGATQGITARGASFIEALAAPAQGHWIAPAKGSLAWALSQARADLLANALERARTHLDVAELMLGGATVLEQAEYWCLLGNWHVESGADVSASSAYQRAYQLNPLPKYQAAWCEAEIRLRFDDARETLPELEAQLQGEDPLINATRSRLAAIQGDYLRAIQIAGALPEPECSSATALVHLLNGDHAAVVNCCDNGLALADSLSSVGQALLLYKARAKFALAHAGTLDAEFPFIPACGLPGVDPVMLLEVWTAVNAGVESFRAAGWQSNIEHLSDIWPSTALALGKGPEILPLLVEATTARPKLLGLQEALRIVAVECGDHELALKANGSLPPSAINSLWATLLFHSTGKHRLSVQSFQGCYECADRLHPRFGTAAVAAILSAQKMVRPDLVRAWLDELQREPSLRSFAALAQYHLALECNQIEKSEALRTLHSCYEQLGHPQDLALTLLQELSPTQMEEAPLCIKIAERITQESLLPPVMAVRVGLALITLKDWSALLNLCQGGKVRAEPGDRMLAFEALALDHIGRSGAARERLATLLASGSTDHVALDTYVTIATRCGYVSEAIDAAERFLEVVESKAQRLECMRTLYSLVHLADPASARLYALALKIGEMIDRNDEQQEGAFLLMVLAAPSGDADGDVATDRERFQERASAFFDKFPNSKILRRGEIRADWSHEAFLSALKSLAGITDAAEALQRRLEKGLQQGSTLVPFSWRPRFALSSVSDVVHLWEVAKASSRDDAKYHLAMTMGPDRPILTAQDLRERVPLLDLTALLVLLDLELIDPIVAFFGTIAVSKATLEELMELSSPMFGSPVHNKCLALQQALRPHLSSILQPSSSATGRDQEKYAVVGRGNFHIADICADQAADFRLYSDDAIFRVFCAGGAEPDGICTLDVLDSLVELGVLDIREKARKVALLCQWNVGLIVRWRDFIALLPLRLLQVTGVSQGIQVLDRDPEFKMLVSAVWDYRLPFQKTMEHAAALLGLMLTLEPISNTAIAAVMIQWFVKAGMSKDAPDQALRTITRLVTFVASIRPLEGRAGKRLWGVYLLIVEWHHGHLDDTKIELAIQALGGECVRLEHVTLGLETDVFSALFKCLPNGSVEARIFANAYSRGLAQQDSGGKRV